MSVLDDVAPRACSGALSRRRFLTISAAAIGCAGLPGAGPVVAGPAQGDLHLWRGLALGAGAEIRLYHHDGEAARRIFTRVENEIRRQEAIFSLYRKDSALCRLNETGRLDAPPFELLELLSLCGRLHRETRGAFDPTVQPLWSAYAEGFATSPEGPDEHDLAKARALVDFEAVSLDAGRIAFARPGMALTFNGIAQGFITDRVSILLREEGLRDVLVDLGEIRANGTTPDGRGWPVRLDPDHNAGDGAARLHLTDRAVASSAVLGTTFDLQGQMGHILDPRLGMPVRGSLRGVSVIAPSAAIADGLSTAAPVLGAAGLERVLQAFPHTSSRILEDDGSARWIGV